MKSDFVIGLCCTLLACIGVFLVGISISPVSSQVAHTPQTSYDWYYKPTQDGSQPIVADNAPFIDEYGVFYLGEETSKEIYLTFDAGFENGNTAAILDVLKEKEVSATFFVTGHFMQSHPELIVRMAQEGHIVGNHTLGHVDLTDVSEDVFLEQVQGLSDLYTEITGGNMPMYLRPPEGRYSEKFLQQAQGHGYTVVFWSFAYMDWLEDDQPSHEEAIDTIISRTHPGEIALLHSTSKTNAEVLGTVIDMWIQQGYSIRSIDALVLRQQFAA